MEIDPRLLELFKLEDLVGAYDHSLQIARIRLKNNPVKLAECEEKVRKVKDDLEALKLDTSQYSMHDKWKHHSYYCGSILFEKKVTSRHPLRYSLADTSNPWFLNKEVRVFNDKSVSESSVKSNIDGLRFVLDAVGLDFQINYFGSHQTATSQIGFSSTSNVTRAQVLGQMISKEQFRNPQFGGAPHGDYLIISKHDSSEPGVIPGSLGIGSFSEGYTISWANSQSVAIHETGHMFGCPHNYNHGEEPYADEVPFLNAYNTSGCVMQWNLGSGEFCDFCLDRLRYFWKGIEDLTGIQFLIK